MKRLGLRGEMAEKALKDVSPSVRELYERGMAAFRKSNLDYAITLFMSVLRREPGLYPCREALRASQLKRVAGKKGIFKKVLGSAGKSSHLARAQLLLRSQPLGAIEAAEEALNGNPRNLAAHRLLGDAAMASGLPKTAVLSYELVVQLEPGDRGTALKLGEALITARNIARAQTVYEELAKLYPTDPEVATALKNAIAKRTMHDGGYDGLEDGQGSYRDILKDREEAVSLEQEGRTVKDEDVAGDLLRGYKQRLEAEPDNLRLLAEVAGLHATRKDFDRALECYERLRDKGGLVDPQVEKKVTQIKAQQMDAQVAQLDPAAADYEARKAALEQERDAMVLADTEAIVQRYPNDLHLRYELGQRYQAAGKVSEAIREFQRAQNNPNRRIKSLLRLGQLFYERGMHDLAARSLVNAISEKEVFDGEKKELIYWLGCVYDKMGRTEEAIEEFKKIYEVDIGFRDVGERVDAYYDRMQ